jgi:ubiquinone/menaquinone biosynthesis C-methylase UbiE
MNEKRKLSLLKYRDYLSQGLHDPLRYYFWPIIGRLYRKRVELALNECTGGQAILEIGYGSGLTFLSLNEIYGEIYGLDLQSNPQIITNFYRKFGIVVNVFKGHSSDLSEFKSNSLDTVLMISILEHLRPHELDLTISEVFRVLKPNGQLVYGVPVDKMIMTVAFLLLGHNIKKIHFSSEKNIELVVKKYFGKGRIISMDSLVSSNIYQIGHFKKS